MNNEWVTSFSTRQYMLSEDFEFYYYADTKLLSVPNHSHSYYEFYFFLEGDVDMLIQGMTFPLAYGDLLIIPPGILHHSHMKSSKKPYRRFVFWLSADYMAELRKLSPDYEYIFTCPNFSDAAFPESPNSRGAEKPALFHLNDFTFGRLQSKAFELLEELHSDRFGKSSMISLCVSALLLQVNRAIYEKKNSRLPEKDHNLFRGIAQYIETHIEEDLSLENIAKTFFVSKYHIAHLFKEKMGISTHQFIQKKRLSMCRQAILEGAAIQTACSKYGFSDYSVFYRAFKKEYGVSPKKMREDALKIFLNK